MKKRYLILIYIIFCLCLNTNVLAATYVTCGNINNIPTVLPNIFNFLFKLIKYGVPIIIIIVGSIDFVKYSAGSDQDMLKKSTNNFFKKLIAGAVVFLILLIVQIGISLISNDQNITQCMKCFIVNKNECSYQDIDENEQIGGDIIDGYENNKKTEDPPENDQKSDGNGKILIIAGHSYSPYCLKVTGECRPDKIASGYIEPTETRKLARKLKSKLSSMGLKADIANELLGGTDQLMNTSFYVEGSTGTSVFNSIDWSRYKYAIELHFNATTDGTKLGTTSGPVILLKNDSVKLPINEELKSKLASITNTKGGDFYRSTFSAGYFQRINVPFTYLEVEYYDNKKAMDNYTAKIDTITTEMAKIIKKYYN